MAKRRTLEETLKLLNQLREDPASDRTTRELRRVLGGKNSFAAARAAEIVGELEIRKLIPDLVAAFDRFMVAPAKVDKNCQAKIAIAEALGSMNYDDEVLFLRGIRHIQREPVWGGSVDTAAALRGASALGLARMQYPEVTTELAELLADAEVPARMAAIQALGYTGRESAVSLLRFKSLIGDDDLGVMAECFNALFQLDPESSLPFVARFLDNPDSSIQELAALALGSSRLLGALEILQNWWSGHISQELRRTALLAIGMLRRDESVELLLALIKEGEPRTAVDAVHALEFYLDDESLRSRIQRVIRGRKDLDLSDSVAEKIGLPVTGSGE